MLPKSELWSSAVSPFGKGVSQNSFRSSVGEAWLCVGHAVCDALIHEMSVRFCGNMGGTTERIYASSQIYRDGAFFVALILKKYQ